jgi:hypothetical protein
MTVRHAVFDVYGNYDVPEGKNPEDVSKEFYELVGRCIKAWARVESGLFEICAFVLKAPREQAAVIYYRTPSIDTRLELTHELVRFVMPQRERKEGGHDAPIVSKWNELRSAIKEMLPARNALAHHPVRQQQPITVGISLRDKERPPRVVVGAPWLELAMSAEEELRQRGKKEPIKHADLPGHLTSVRSLAVRLDDFYEELKAQRKFR